MFNITKWLPLIFTGMQVAQKMGGTGKQKLQAVVDSLPDILSSLEAGAGDVINEDAVKSALENAISAIKSFENAVAAAKKIKNH